MTTTQPVDAIVARIREALADYESHPETSGMRDISYVRLNWACSPGAIRALLAHMDGLKKDSEMLDWLLPKFSGKGLREAGVVYGGGVESIRVAIAAAMAEGADRE